MSSESYIVPEFIADEIYDKGYEDGYDAAVLDELEEAQTLALSYYMKNKQALDKILKWRDVMKELTETYEDFRDEWLWRYEVDCDTHLKFAMVIFELHQRFELDAKIKELGERLAKTLSPNAECKIYGVIFH
jgi:hypothetical protein